MARWKLSHRENLKFCHFQHVHCGSKNPISPKVFNRYSKSLQQLEDVERGNSGGKFQDRLNNFGDIGFLLAQCTDWKRQNFKCCRCAKFSPCHCKSKIPALLKLSSQMPTPNIFELKQRFRKSVQYLWRYKIFAGKVYMLRVAKFQMLSMRKFSSCHCKSKIPV